jgi:hypothetical protein
VGKLKAALDTKNIDTIREYLQSSVLPPCIVWVNEIFSPRRLLKLSRSAELLPTDKRQLSSYRTRLGTILEYGLSTAIDNWLTRNDEQDHRFCFVSYHDYPDFVLRDSSSRPIVRVEMKAVESESDEQAARFDAATNMIDSKRDLLLFIAWEWKKDSVDAVEVEYPHIFSYAIVKASDLTIERDRRVLRIGGKIEDGKVMVPSTKTPGKLVPDPGNYGKLWRIIERERRNSADISESCKDLVRFLGEIDKKSPHKRFKT